MLVKDTIELERIVRLAKNPVASNEWKINGDGDCVCIDFVSMYLGETFWGANFDSAF